MMDCLAKDTGLGGIGCDNMTVVIVAILGGKTSDEWYQSVKQRYEAGVGSSEHGSFSEASLNPSESEPSNEVSGELPKKTLPQKSENTPTQTLDTTPSGGSEIAMGNATKDLPKDILDAAPMDGTVDSAPTPTSDTALSSDASEPTDLSIPESKKLD
ncbi:Protein phosphatase 2C-like protein [Zancudomyces culisetae]|uniref:Protein phosphatase 2C-like protein n=1 Tax=Zancudomyces culisetae TaxID=1213189 RepID=A0A1R1PMN9_ZANCU|nr:Protein phosphatase 2C-like protein [Zancudomyces culisetae]|eukprot:OMH82240.1 Protein phosphatase 2C-like protein [Zancudomyces culisetae]